MAIKEKLKNEAFEKYSDALECMLTLRELAFMAGTTPEIIAQLMELDLIEPCRHAETLLFRVENAALVRKLLRLQRHLQIGLDSMALVFDLLERIDELERRLNDLER